MRAGRISPLVFIFVLFLNNLVAQHSESLSCSHLKSHAKRNTLGRSKSDMDNYDVKFYFLDVDADNLSSYIKAKVTMDARVVSGSLSQIVVGLSNMLQVDSVFLNGAKLEFTHANNEIVFSPANAFSEGEIFRSEIYYRGDGTSNSFFSGISNRPTAWGDRITWTLSEPENAIDWFACKQVLEDKADSAYIYVTVPSHLKVGSNGILEKVVDLPADRKRFEWKTRYPIDYYLISIAIGEYVEYNTTATVDGKEMPIQHYIYESPGVLDNVKPLLDLTGTMVEELSELFGPYPFANEKYGHVMAPLGGGMEHQTMSTMDGFSFTLIAHELGHQWFGDNVTCGTWQDIWINEGFARYCEYLMIEKINSKANADAWMKVNYDDVRTVSSGSVYVPAALAADEFRIFNFTLTYNKGGALVHMLRNIINDDGVFFDALKAFQTQYRGGVATGNDLRNVLEEKSGKDFGNFFNEWYYGEGYPVFNIRWNYDSDTLYLKQTQTASSSVTPFFHIPLDYKIEFDNVDPLIIRTDADSPQQMFKYYLGENVKKVTVDPQNWVLKSVQSLVRDTNLKWVPIVTELPEDHDAAFTIYPNPSDSYIYVHPKDARAYTVELVSPTGVSVFAATSIRGEKKIDTALMHSGLYLVKISDASGVIVSKVFVK
jgi:aminopeptidase N